MTNHPPWNTDNPLDKMPNETKRSYPAFMDYFHMGVGRSLKKLHTKYIQQTSSEPPTKKINTITTWSHKNQWVARVEKADKLSMITDEEEWRERRLAIREREYNQGLQLFDLFDEILTEAPNFLKTKRKFIRGRDGESDKEIITVALDLWLAIKATETASKLQRLGSQMPTDKTEVDINIPLADWMANNDDDPINDDDPAQNTES